MITTSQFNQQFTELCAKEEEWNFKVSQLAVKITYDGEVVWQKTWNKPPTMPERYDALQSAIDWLKETLHYQP